MFYSFVRDKCFPNVERKVSITDQSSKGSCNQLPSDRETIIDGYALRWPQFGVKNVFFEGN